MGYCELLLDMPVTCIGHIMGASVRPCLGHSIGIETRASVRHVRDMYRPRDVSQCKTCLGHASAMKCVSVRPYLGHGIGTDMLELMTRACHGRVKDMGQEHGRVPGHVKTPVATAGDVESNALALAERTALVESEPVTMDQDGGPREVYL
ncbi:Acetylglutamate kinase [Gossypium arboreum]|uniref:Acetylglutamate kinase n=1 Tax=Gossypium arboreum TaxID=29729 RepID=A0A0B0NRL8_GOSAR|nr:Acetylglutamate kinase [Gossypium arboreum]